MRRPDWLSLSVASWASAARDWDQKMVDNAAEGLFVSASHDRLKRDLATVGALEKLLEWGHR